MNKKTSYNTSVDFWFENGGDKSRLWSEKKI